MYGIQNGGDRKSESVPNKSDVIFQNELAKQMGMSVDTLSNYKLLSEMIPELEELLDTGVVTKTTALAIMMNSKRNMRFFTHT
ncbi:hypothetical protein IO98_11540 [Lacrimispora celerecrescens]|uniref:Uncharacterized protein n=1 Tax=Lacrimispora celerecrescens TaxID=29354 RepID=A0A084JMD0_9FIRM|nr:hypothetical protein IO98_11540 [Lacrimispora celerecrescens]